MNSVNRTRKQRNWTFPAVLAVVVVGGGVGAWWYFAGLAPAAPRTDQAAAAPKRRVAEVVLSSDDNRVAPADRAKDEVLAPRGGPLAQNASQPSSNSSGMRPPPSSAPASTPASRPAFAHAPKPAPVEPPSAATVRAAIGRWKAGQVIEARHELNRLLSEVRSASDAAEIRRHLGQIAEETIFCKARVPDDPLVEAYTVQPGETLIKIGKLFQTPADVIMMVNGIGDAKTVRARQELKVLRGPFHAKVYKSQFRIDVYLKDVYVRSFNVGLGGDNPTPTGVWTVKDRLKNPTYYPPRSAKDKKIIRADDPKNPLGEFWVGLNGVDGEAAGAEGFGIHGTIEPESIGRNASAGCVRMLNEDAQFIYGVMQPGKSMVTILP